MTTIRSPRRSFLTRAPSRRALRPRTPVPPAARAHSPGLHLHLVARLRDHAPALREVTLRELQARPAVHVDRAFRTSTDHRPHADPRDSRDALLERREREPPRHDAYERPGPKQRGEGPGVLARADRPIDHRPRARKRLRPHEDEVPGAEHAVGEPDERLARSGELP